MQHASSLHERLNAAVSELLALLSRLESEIAHKPAARPRVGGSGGSSSPLASWNTPVAMLLLEIYAGIRTLERDIRFMVAGVQRLRGPGSAHTEASIKELPALCAGAPYATAAAAATQLERWSYRARLVLGEAEPYSRLPRLPGESEPACPYCSMRTLRFRPYSGRIRCVNPDCRDGNDERPAGRIEVGNLSGEPMITWSDKTIGVGGV